MNSDLAIDEARALALPQDYPMDFGLPNGMTRHCCQECLKTFVSLPTRQICRKCAEGL